MKALDGRQLANWEEYLNFEIQEGMHDRIVLLYERCVITCAYYERFWCKYARYVENYYSKKQNSNGPISMYLQKSKLNVEIVSRKQTEEEEEVIDSVTSVVNSMLNQLERADELEVTIVQEVLESIFLELDLKSPTCVPMDVESVDTKDSPAGTVRASSNEDDLVSRVSSSNLCGHSENERTELPPKSGEQINHEPTSPGFTSLISVPTFPKTSLAWHEAVRDIYKRACIVHCPKKPAIRLQWAAFEEEIGKSKN